MMESEQQKGIKSNAAEVAIKRYLISAKCPSKKDIGVFSIGTKGRLTILPYHDAMPNWTILLLCPVNGLVIMKSKKQKE